MTTLDDVSNVTLDPGDGGDAIALTGVPLAQRVVQLRKLDLGAPEPREDVIERSGRSGSDDATEFHGGREVTADVRLIGSSLLERLLVAVTPGRRCVLEFDREGTRRRMVLSGRRHKSVWQSDVAPILDMGMQWWCPSGLMESTSLQVAALPPQDDDGGVAWPVEWPAQWGASATGIVDLANDGTADAPVIWTIQGPKVAPALHDVDRDVVLQLTGTVPDGSVAVVDVGARTVELDGVDRWAWVTGDSGWPHVAAGGGRMRETSTSGGGLSSVAWRHTYQ